MNTKVHDLHLFAARLRNERKRLGRSQSELAAAGGVAKPTLIGYEQGVRKPDIEFLAGVIGVGVDVHYLITGTRGNARVVKEVDWQLIDAIHTGVENACRSLNMRVNPEKRSELVRVLYEHFIAERGVDTDALLRIVSLAAA
jgi:transcriptional regulator with XRE-family HTH domain